MELSETLSKFIEINRQKNFGSSVFAMYVFLLEYWFSNEKKSFSCTNSTIQKNLNLSIHTIIKNRKILEENQLIHCVKSENNSIFYQILPIIGIQKFSDKKLFPFEEFQSETPPPIVLSPPKEKIFSTEKKENISIENQNRILKSTQSTEKENIIAPIIKKSQIEKEKTPSNPPSISKESSKNNSLQEKIPSFEEIKNFAKSIRTYTDGMEEHLKLKYDSWVESGWVNGNGMKITSWKNTVRNCIPFLKSSSKFSIQEIPKIKYPIKTYNE